MNHNRKLGLCGASLTTARLGRNVIAVMEGVRDEIEGAITSLGLMDGAPFSWITVSIRFGLKNEEVPHYEAVNAKYGDLPLAIEIDTREIQMANESEMARLIGIATLKALVHAASVYHLPSEALQLLLDGKRKEEKRA